MNWKDVGENITTVIFSTAAISFVLKHVFESVLCTLSDRLTENHKHELSKILEDKKANNERKNYVSKVRFDKEFEIYTTLSKNLGQAVFGLQHIVDYVNNDITTEQFKDKFNYEIKSSYNSTMVSIQMYAPFISTDIYMEYIDITTIFRELLEIVVFFGKYESYNKFENIMRDLDVGEKEQFTRYRKILIEKYHLITERYGESIEHLRDYLENLEVLD